MVWTTYRFSQITDIIGGKEPGVAPTTAKSLQSLPFVKAGSLLGIITDDDYESLEHYSRETAIQENLKIAPRGSSVVATSGMSATLGRVAFLSRDCIISSTVSAITARQDIDPKFLHHFLKFRPTSDLILNPSYPTVRKRDIENKQIAAPNIDEQRRIAAILDKAEEVGQESVRSDKVKEILIRSVFIEFFGDPIFNPKGWPKQPLVDVAEKVTVGYVGPVNKYLDESGIPMFRTGNVGNYYLNYDKMIHISREFHMKIQKSAIMKNDLLINRHVTDEMKCSIVSEDVGEANCMNMLLVRSGELLNPLFWRY
jgi:type I restriction enzyme S subunit